MSDNVHPLHPYEPIDVGDPDVNRQLNMMRALADDSPPQWWWLSFTDARRRRTDRFLGVVIVEAPNIPMACQRAWILRINPGGEVMASSLLHERVPAAEWRERLLTRAEVDTLNAMMVRS